jgi:hypothetical protein
MQKERIHDISVEGQTLTDHADIAEACWAQTSATTVRWTLPS